MTYRKVFDPASEPARPTLGAFPGDDLVYVFDNERMVLAVNVALQTGRPLLVFGPPGSGKSTLGPNIARILGWNSRTEVITARTEPEDLLWRFDALRRLNDAQAGALKPEMDAYFSRGVLWEAFADPQGFVAIIDEIDKADPDVPNGLLKPLGTLSFETPWGQTVSASTGRSPLVVITTNDERQLSGPFLRRCITIRVGHPTTKHLLKVAECHLGEHYDRSLALRVAAELEQAGRDAPQRPSTAEFLDTLVACIKLEINADAAEWELLRDVALLKRRGSDDLSR
ncbi:ATP-binding protein [Rhizocola hellebori]|uniref:ATP-binding protein n=1 Tax=Rhizocola hellebori TaxID=1392758 RepID=A0A8J3VDG7_9ACTN|nr:MoxR family ATPase [Rhizocola hellebori]GIH02442.1 ATP-binding protein [Rhizocola hellebori]